MVDLATTDLSQYELLGDEQRAWILAGEVDIYPGRNPSKPVLRWTAGNTLGKPAGALAKGSGVSPAHVDAANGRKSGIKQTSEYVALIQRRLSAEDGGAFEDVIEATFTAAIGTSKSTKVTCPECEHQFYATLDAPGDPRAQKLIIETLAGGATKRTETDINMRVLQADLSELVNIDPAQIVNAFRPGLSQEEIERRREYVDIRAEDVR
jgi:hypothetical protein